MEELFSSIEFIVIKRKGDPWNNYSTEVHEDNRARRPPSEDSMGARGFQKGCFEKSSHNGSRKNFMGAVCGVFSLTGLLSKCEVD